MSVYDWLLIAGALLVLLFSSALLFGAPFLPTLGKQTAVALDMLGLEAGQTLLELGSGDGRILREAARRGVKSIGYEINPLLVLYSKLICWPQRELITIHWRNYWHVRLPAADAVYVFLLVPYMQKLDNKLEKDFKKPVKVISFAFAFPNRQPTAERNGVMLYEFKPLKH